MSSVIVDNLAIATQSVSLNLPYEVGYCTVAGWRARHHRHPSTVSPMMTL